MLSFIKDKFGGSMDIKSYDFYYEIRSLPCVKGIYLYGSRAKGDAQERSDIDLAINCPDASDSDWRQILQIIENADTLFSIDCVRYDTLDDVRLKHEIDKNKVVLFEKKDNSYNWYDIFLDLGEAIEKFENTQKPDFKTVPYFREASIQIFEYSFELFWKLLKKICLNEGFEVNSPRSALQKAYALKLIDDEEIWLDMIEDRNLTSHTYKQPTAKAVVGHFALYAKVMRKSYDSLKDNYKL